MYKNSSLGHAARRKHEKEDAMIDRIDHSSGPASHAGRVERAAGDVRADIESRLPRGEEYVFEDRPPRNYESTSKSSTRARGSDYYERALQRSRRSNRRRDARRRSDRRGSAGLAA